MISEVIGANMVQPIELICESMLSTLKHFHLTAGMRQAPDMWHNGVVFLFEVSKLLKVCTEVLCRSMPRAKNDKHGVKKKRSKQQTPRAVVVIMLQR